MTRSKAPTLLPQPAGPPWWGSVMGTAILANLASLHGYSVPAWLILAIAWILLIAQSVGFARRVHHDRTVLTDALTIPGEATGWGMVSMGILAVGAATAQIIPDTWGIDAVLWTIGTILGIAITPWFCAKILTHRAGQPVFAWGLPVVAPMVSATGGANLSGHVPPAFELPTLVVATGCFALTLTCALPIFAYVYAHGWPPINASVSAFIPLGVVGQSTAAAHALSQHWERHGWHWTDAADHYGIIMACIASAPCPGPTPASSAACATTWRLRLVGGPPPSPSARAAWGPGRRAGPASARSFSSCLPSIGCGPAPAACWRACGTTSTATHSRLRWHHSPPEGLDLKPQSRGRAAARGLPR